MRNVIFSLLVTLCLGVSAGAQPDNLKLVAATDRAIYTSASPSVYVQAKIVPTVPSSATDGSVRNLVFVLDRSGSMAGEPMQALRQAVSGALGTLAERDVVSIVLFGSEVETLLPAQRRDQVGELDALLAKIEPAGGAALYDALNQGAAQLRRYATSATLNHLVLVTDGKATKGPRERDDFMRLAALFASEGFTLSTIGLGDEFEEDLLAKIARAGNGRFHFAAQPADLSTVLVQEVNRLRTPLARDVELAIEFGYGSEEVEPAGWTPAAVEGSTVTYHFPAVFAGSEVSVLAGAKVPSRTLTLDAAVVRLRWTDVGTGATYEALQRLTVYCEGGSWASVKSVDREVLRAAVGAVISESMQLAIEQLDKGDLKRALRELRHARDKAQAMNDRLEDEAIIARIQVLDSYLAEIQTRGLNQLDRKILRSGLHNQFDIPTEEMTEK